MDVAHKNICLLVRVERMLQPDSVDAYIKPDVKHTQKLRKTVEVG